MTRTNAVILDDRGVSEVVGYILLVGLVLTATAIAVAMGAEAIGGLESENDATSARAILEDVDAELETVSRSSSAPTRTFDFSGTAGGHLQVQSGGWLNVSLMSATDRRCSTETRLGTIRFEEDSRIVAYEAGGTWERSPGGGSAMLTQPDIAFRDGTLDVDLVNISGVINQGDTEARFNQTATRERNLDHQNDLGACDSIDHVNITIKSSFHQAWGEYLQEQTGGDLNATESDEEVVQVQLDSGELPRRVDMYNNSVVNLNDSRSGVDIDYMEDVSFGSDPRNLTVDKDAGNSYLVSVTALSDRPPQIGDVQTLQAANVSNRTRGPVDVSFVIDESGSMGGSKIQNAREAAKIAVGTMNTTFIGDRAGIVGYEAYPEYEFIDDSGEKVYFSSDNDSANSTIDGLSAGGSTDISAALNASLASLSYREDRRDAHIILLTDGRNQPGSKCWEYVSSDCEDYFDQRTRNGAHIAAERGIPVHTFAYGSGANEGLLRYINSTTGGRFNSSGDGEALKDFFQSVIEGITREDDYVTRTPLTTNMTSGGQAHPPQIVGDTDSIASVSNSNGQTFLNINDPTAPTLFSHSFAVDDGEPVAINATKYECADDGWRDTGGSTEVGGTTYPIARCTEIVATNDTLEDDRIEHYLNGSDVTSLRTNDDINKSLAPYTTNMSGTHRLTNLSSNQVIFNLNFSQDPESGLQNNLVLLYEIGLSEEEASGANVINVRESTVTLD